jgi:predicted nucleic acid-binding protein
LPPAEARGLVENYLLWAVETNKPQTILAASEIEERHKISFWDALIIHAARQARAEKVLTEDLNHGQTIEGVLIENPFFSSR